MLCQLLLPIVMFLSVLNAELVLTIVTHMKNYVSFLQKPLIFQQNNFSSDMGQLG